MSRGAADDGAVAGWEVLPFGFLLFVVGALVLANAWGVVDTKMAVTAAAREGARAYVEAPEAGSAPQRASRAVRDVLAAHGRDAQPPAVSIRGQFARCAPVSVTVAVTVPSVVLPWVGGFGGDITARSTHGEVVDPLRSGVPGEAGCVRR